MDSQISEWLPHRFSRERKKSRCTFCMRLLGQLKPVSTPWIIQRYSVATLTTTPISRSFISWYICNTGWDTCFIVIILIHSVLCLTTGPKSPPKRFLHIVRSRASSFKWEYPRLSLRSSSSFLHLLPRLLVTSISPFIYSSITCFRRQYNYIQIINEFEGK